MSSPPVTKGAFGPQSIYQVARELKKEQHTLFNCLASILSDAAFIQEIRLLYPDQPLLANLRAGGWYAPSPDGTCYFKSTDGHQNNCNFSVTRLNWHVAELAAQKGGVIIVDATRKGKRFPDAMSKTIPIWAAVLNRAVARVRTYDANKAQRRAAVGESVTAVADTQTTISVRSEEGQPGCAGDSTAALEAATQQGLQDHSAAATTQQQPCKASLVDSSQQQPQEHVAAGQHLLHSSEQSQGQQPQHPAHPFTTQQCYGGAGVTSIEESIQAASALDACDCSCSTQVVQLLVDCLGPSIDLMSGLSTLECRTDSAASTAAGPYNLPAAAPVSAACSAGSSSSSSSSHVAAAGTAPGAAPAPAAGASAAAGLAGCLGCPKCCCLQRSKSVHISPQPSLHEWLDEMDVLRRLSFIAADSRTRRPPRVSCPSTCTCSSKVEGQSTGVSISRSESAAADCSGSAPAVSCLLATADEDGAPVTPAAAAGSRTQHVQEALQPLQTTAGLGTPVASSRLGNGHRAAAAAGRQPLGSTVPSSSSTAAAEGLSSPAFQLSTSDSTSAYDAGDAGEPVTPRLMFGSINSSSSARSSSGDEPLLWPLQQDPLHVAGPPGEQHPPLTQLQVADAVMAEPSSSTQGLCAADSSGGGAHGDFAFPSQHQLAVSAGSSVGAEAAGHLAGSGVASSGGSSCGSGLVRLPDMPVVVLNGTSHQPGDAASILDIWRGTDLEDVACLPDIADFRPGVYHLPEARQRQRQVSIDTNDWPSTQQQQQQQQQAGRACNASSNSSSSRGIVSLSAEVCLRAEQQMVGRVSVSTWLEDDDACAGCDAPCAFAVPALPPSCASLATRCEGAEPYEAEASCCSLGCGSQGSCSVCSDDSTPCSRQSSSTTAGLSSSPPGGGASASFSCSAAAAADSDGDAGPVEWDTSLHLPLWVSSHEREAIEAKLDLWVERLLEVGADVRGLAAVLSKPLRPLWVSQASVIWTNQVAQPSSLPFTPLLLVSASQPHAGERQAVKSAWLALARGSCSSSSPERPLTPTGLSGALSDDSSDDDLDEEGSWDGMGLACSWGSRQGRQGLLRGSPAKQQCKHSKAGAAGSGSSRGASGELGSWSYVYVPGAGDDEESWATGLTPALFWQHCDALLRCGPSNIRPAVKQLLQLHKSASFGGAAAASLAAAAVRGLAAAPAIGGNRAAGPGTRPMSPLGLGGSSRGSGSSGRAGGCVGAVLTDKHHLAPQGCDSAGVSLHMTPAAPGAFWVGTTGLALGNLEGASAADVWRAFDAVLCCGTAMVPVLQGEYQAMRLAAARVPATPAACAISSSAPSAGLWVQQHKQQQKQKQQGHSSSLAKPAAGQRPLSSSFCTSDAAHSHWVRQQQQLAAAGDSAASADQAQLSLEFSRVANGPALSRKPVRKSGMLSALLSKAGASAAAEHPHGGSVNVPGAADEALPVAELQHGSDASSAGGSDAGRVCSSSYYSVSSEDGPPGGSSSSRSALPRLKWLPIESAKRDRSSLKQHLQEALEFVSAHLAAGHNVLLHDVEGHDNCVCCVVAVLSACFAHPPAAAEAAGNPGAGAAEPLFSGPWLNSCQGGGAAPQQQQQGQQQCATPLLPPAPVSKQSVRQQLALVSGAYPLARPTRAMLKQVFNFFEERKRIGQ